MSRNYKKCDKCQEFFPVNDAHVQLSLPTREIDKRATRFVTDESYLEQWDFCPACMELLGAGLREWIGSADV